jgi:osmotically-inducible protein OsmY
MLSNRSSQRISTGRRNVRAFAAAALIATVSLQGCAAFPQSANPSADKKITADVETRFRQHAQLESPNQLDVQTINGVVYLHGTVSSGLQRKEAEWVANEAPDVAQVVDSISVVH